MVTAPQRIEPAGFNWDDFIELMVSSQRVVPLIGEGALGILGSERERPFSDVLAERLAATLGLASGQGSLRAVAADALPGRTLQALKSRLFREHEKLLGSTRDVDIAPPVMRLAEITDFPIILTTSTHGLLQRALRVARGRDPTVVVLGGGEDNDLPAEWTPTSKPTLVHLFGRMSPSLNFAVTDEDILESVWALQNERRPERLLDELCNRNLLFIGNRFPDWLARMFMRSMRRKRLSLDVDTIKAVADDGIEQEPQLVLFLQRLEQTWVFRGVQVNEFVTMLHERWSAAARPLAPELACAASVPPSFERDPAVFVSFSDDDREAARRVFDHCDRSGLDVWFDERRLYGGDAYDARIRQNIDRCAVFVALLSANTERRAEAYFRKEWRWAIERSKTMADDRRFIVPVVVDSLTPHSFRRIPYEFEKVTIEPASRGDLSSELLVRLVDEVRRFRGRNARA